MTKVPQTGLQARQKGGLTLCRLEDEVLVYDAKRGRASCLNSFAADVLELCDGRRSVSEIVRDLAFDDADEDMVRLALADLQKAHLLREGFSVDASENGRINRRDVLRRVGLGSAVAVPVITGIAFPAAAVTCLSPGGNRGHGEPCGCKEDCAPGLNCTGNLGFKFCGP
jgi:hypothetical protein